MSKHDNQQNNNKTQEYLQQKNRVLGMGFVNKYSIPLNNLVKFKLDEDYDKAQLKHNINIVIDNLEIYNTQLLSDIKSCNFNSCNMDFKKCKFYNLWMTTYNTILSNRNLDKQNAVQTIRNSVSYLKRFSSA